MLQGTFGSARHFARHLQGTLQGTCKALCKAVLVVKSCANISSCFLAISLSSHWLPLAQPLLTARHLQGILHGTCAWQNLEAVRGRRAADAEEAAGQEKTTEKALEECRQLLQNTFGSSELLDDVMFYVRAWIDGL